MATEIEFIRQWDPEEHSFFVPHMNCAVCGRLEDRINVDSSHIVILYDFTEYERVARRVCSNICRDMLVLSQFAYKI